MADLDITGDDVRRVDFPTKRFIEAYDMDDVDAFKERIAQTIDILQGNAAPWETSIVTAREIQRTAFRTTRLKTGYDPKAVDAFCDEAARVINALQHA